MANIFDKVRNFFIVPKLSISNVSNSVGFQMSAGGSNDQNKNLSNTIVPTQFLRKSQDLSTWKEAITEAEQLPYPYRVKMQQIYIDAINDAHVYSCIKKRKNLNLSRKYVMVDENLEENEEWTKYLDKTWFYDYLNYVLDAIFYGYTLISIGDIIDNELPQLSIIRRWNVSPDRLQVSSVTYVPSGTSFVEGEVADWHIWVKTPTDVGVSGCGYGLLYPVSMASILIRNNMQYNASYNELFGQPMKVLKSSTNNEEERERLYEMLSLMGEAPGIVINTGDEMEFVEAKSGSGYKSYADFEQRLEKKISKLILGHADAIDSIPGKLGNNDENSAAALELQKIQEHDAKFMMPYIDQLINKLRQHGVKIPDNLKVMVLNSDEDDQIAQRANEKALDVATIVKTLSDGGYVVEKKYIEDETGIKLDISDNEI